MLVQLIALLCTSTITHATSVLFQKPHYPQAIFPKIIATKNAPPGPYNASQAILDSRGALSTSIQYGIVPSTNALISKSAKEQMTQAMTNMAAVFTAAGFNLQTDATSCWLYGAAATNAADFGDISGVYNTFFPKKHHHPARNPTGANLLCIKDKNDHVCNGEPLIGVMCRGFPNGGKRVVPPSPFFDTDFNAQGLLVDGSSRLYTSAQVGIDPTAGKLLHDPPMVPGGAVNETRQAMANIAQVFATAYPKDGKDALSKHASECQLIIVNTTGKINDVLWKQVKDEFDSFFTGVDIDVPPVAISSFPVGSLPIPANVAVSCNGVGSKTISESTTGRTVTTVGKTTYLQTTAYVGSDVESLFHSVESDFKFTFPCKWRSQVFCLSFFLQKVIDSFLFSFFKVDQWNTSGWPAIPATQETTNSPIFGTVTECQFWIANIAAPREIYIEDIMTTLKSFFNGNVPPLTVTKDGTRRDCNINQYGIPTGDCYTLQCFGSFTEPPKPVCLRPNSKCNYVNPDQGMPCCYGGCSNVHSPTPGVCNM